jgi:hypothetical protein
LAGKARSSRNAWKGGLRDALRELARAMREQAEAQQKYSRGPQKQNFSPRA